MKNSSSIFNGFVSEKPKANLLAIGKHLVKIIRVVLIDSFMNMDGSAKEDQKWSVQTPQIGVSFQDDKGAVISMRLNGLGYMHSDDYDPEEMKEQGLIDVDGYACKELDDGKYERIVSEANTEACKNIMNQFLYACGVPEGTTLPDFIKTALEGEVELEIEVVANDYNPDKPSPEVKSYSRKKETAEPTLDLQ